MPNRDGSWGSAGSKLMKMAAGAGAGAGRKMAAASVIQAALVNNDGRRRWLKLHTGAGQALDDSKICPSPGQPADIFHFISIFSHAFNVGRAGNYESI